MNNFNFRNFAFATLLTQTGVMTSAAVAAAFDVPQEDVDILARYSVGNLKTQPDRQGVDIFKADIKLNNKVVATYQDSISNGNIKFEVFNDVAIAPLVDLDKKYNSGDGPELVCEPFIQAFYYLHSIYKPMMSRNLVFVNLRGSLNDIEQLSFHKKPTLKKLATTQAGYRHLVETYDKQRKETEAEKDESTFIVIINSPRSFEKIGIDVIKPYDVN